jgi:hypothetical protein
VKAYVSLSTCRKSQHPIISHHDCDMGKILIETHKTMDILNCEHVFPVTVGNLMIHTIVMLWCRSCYMACVFFSKPLIICD